MHMKWNEMKQERHFIGGLYMLRVCWWERERESERESERAMHKTVYIA